MTDINEDFFNEINTILDSTIEGILLSKDGFIVNINKSFVDILGYESKADITGNLAAGCLLPSAKESFIEYNNNMFQEISLLSKDGAIIPAIIQIKDIEIKNRDFKMVSILDLTELKKKETLLIKQSRLAAMGEMISMIAHQWRQPLTAISVAIANLKLKTAMKKVDLDFFDLKLDEINTYLQYTSQTIDDFKDFFKNDKAKKYFCLNDLVQNGVNMVLPSLKIHGIEIKVEDKKLNKLFLNQNELLQVLLNIINNSKDAFLENKTKESIINIEFFENKQEQHVIIEDNAGGIPNDIIDRIFEPYFSTKDDLNGTGLGLYMSKIIVEQQCNGSILVNNTEKGCRFTVIISK